MEKQIDKQLEKLKRDYACKLNIIDSLKEELQFKDYLKVLQKYYKEISKSNVNLRLGLENLFLEI